MTSTKGRRYASRPSKLLRVAQYYRRADKRWTFRFRNDDGIGYTHAAALVGNDDGFPDDASVIRAARLCGILEAVPIDLP